MSLLSLNNLTKHFNVPVLKGVDLQLAKGEVLALMGANGAGKSTLCNIISGRLCASAGAMQMNGQTYAPTRVAEAEALGVRMVMQELNQVNTLSVAENIGLAKLPSRWGIVCYRRLYQQARQALVRVGLSDLDPAMPMAQLGVGQQQLVEIAKTLNQPCKLLILDEPTAALTDPQIDVLFEQIKLLKSRGVGVIYISHRLADIKRIADTVTVLRDGKVVSSLAQQAVTSQQIITDMSGVESTEQQEFTARRAGADYLTLNDYSQPPVLKNINLTIKRGEILGIGGLIGAGRTELLRAIFGADQQAHTGAITITALGQAYRPKHPAQAVRRGIGLIPEDRKQQALLAGLSIQNNISLANMKAVASRGFISSQAEAKLAQHWLAKLAIKCDGLHQAIGELSGGNQQKAIIARWLEQDCDLLLFDEPTRGIDVHTKRMIYQLLDELARAGKAVVVVSSETEELTQLCDRIAVLSAGEISQIFDRGQWSEAALMAAACKNFIPPPATAPAEHG